MVSDKEFAEMANPHSWMLVADNLHQQAVKLQSISSGEYLLTRGADGRETARWPVENRSIFLLAGFALENVLKAFLVYENPGWLANGRLARKLRSHKLTELAAMVSNVPWPKRGHRILLRFEGGLESWARYPCALNSSDSEVERVLPEALWCLYLDLMRAYGKELKKRLAQGWSGPFGVGGYWTVGEGFLDAK